MGEILKFCWRLFYLINEKGKAGVSLCTGEFLVEPCHNYSLSSHNVILTILVHTQYLKKTFLATLCGM